MKQSYIMFGYIFVILFFNSYAQDTSYSQSVRSSTVLATDTTTLGQKLSEYFSNPSRFIGLLVTIPPGQETGWHKHTVPGCAYVLKGCLSVAIENGKTFDFKEGDSFAEVINVNHNGKNRGKDTVQLIAFFIGTDNKPITIKRAIRDTSCAIKAIAR